MDGPKANLVAWVIVLGVLPSAAVAQHTAKSTANRPVQTSANSVSESSPSRLLTTDESLAIIGAALEIRFSTHSSGDCSHLVHAIYERAGFPYRYADSSRLYDGTEPFRQVAHPQPGDLAVWRGHAAIVISPAQHSFFSSTRSGLRVESYDSEYWKHRGSPRFFRYTRPASSSSASATRTASAHPPTLRNVDSRTPLTLEGHSDNVSGDKPSTSGLATVSNFPPILITHTVRPTPKQVNETLSQHFDETGKALRAQNVLRLSERLIVFDHLEISVVHLKENQAYVGVKINGISSLEAGRGTRKKRSEQQRWVLTRRDGDTWELLLAPKATYLPRDLAIRIFANQLAALAEPSEAGDSSKDQAQLARILLLLLDK